MRTPGMKVCEPEAVKDTSPKSLAVSLSHPQFAKPSIFELPPQECSEFASDVFVIIRMVAHEVSVAMVELPSDYRVQQW